MTELNMKESTKNMEQDQNHSFEDDPFDPYTCPECQKASEQCTCVWHDTGRGYFQEELVQQEENKYATNGE